jgi:hypothetical protein
MLCVDMEAGLCESDRARGFRARNADPCFTQHRARYSPGAAAPRLAVGLITEVTGTHLNIFLKAFAKCPEITQVGIAAQVRVPNHYAVGAKPRRAVSLGRTSSGGLLIFEWNPA